ncbi:hypothetical protein BZG36_04045 [Bifiguratus adelaidae]|uniref:BTB domain-containing protein n=1 Tax=Bifiguratus adelaidae TaxID=1938954 RepID=A0A261Y069_9FUNG|nr:hypothetical protein BZG36_04045 [Bifiguratus adelaidae]
MEDKSETEYIYHDSTSDPPEQAAAAKPSGREPQADAGVIRCICGFDHDDGFTIQCEHCYVWQHAFCVNIKPENIPDKYLCEQCNPVPKSFDIQRAVEHQRKVRQLMTKRRLDRDSPPTSGRRNENQKRKSKSGRGGVRTSSQDRKGTGKHGRGVNGDHKRGSLTLSDNEVMEDDDMDYVPITSNIISASGVRSIFADLVSTWKATQVKKRSRSLSVSQSNHDDPSNSNSDIKTETQEQEADQINNFVPMESQSLARPFIRIVPKSVVTTIADLSVGLFADCDIAPGCFILEYQGNIVVQSDYKAADKNRYGTLGTPMRYVAFYPSADLCVDARIYGNEARYLRRSCHPNVELKCIIVPDDDDQEPLVHLGLFSRTMILKGQEMTVAWDWATGSAGHQAWTNITSGAKAGDDDDIDIDEDDSSRIFANAAAVCEDLLHGGECACADDVPCAVRYLAERGGVLLGEAHNLKHQADAAKQEGMVKREYEAGGLKSPDEDLEMSPREQRKLKETLALFEQMDKKSARHQGKGVSTNDKFGGNYDRLGPPARKPSKSKRPRSTSPGSKGGVKIRTVNNRSGEAANDEDEISIVDNSDVEASMRRTYSPRGHSTNLTYDSWDDATTESASITSDSDDSLLSDNDANAQAFPQTFPNSSLLSQTPAFKYQHLPYKKALLLRFRQAQAKSRTFTQQPQPPLAHAPSSQSVPSTMPHIAATTRQISKTQPTSGVTTQITAGQTATPSESSAQAPIVTADQKQIASPTNEHKRPATESADNSLASPADPTASDKGRKKQRLSLQAYKERRKQSTQEEEVNVTVVLNRYEASEMVAPALGPVPLATSQEVKMEIEGPKETDPKPSHASPNTLDLGDQAVAPSASAELEPQMDSVKGDIVATSSSPTTHIAPVKDDVAVVAPPAVPEIDSGAVAPVEAVEHPDGQAVAQVGKEQCSEEPPTSLPPANEEPAVVAAKAPEPAPPPAPKVRVSWKDYKAKRQLDSSPAASSTITEEVQQGEQPNITASPLQTEPSPETSIPSPVQSTSGLGILTQDDTDSYNCLVTNNKMGEHHAADANEELGADRRLKFLPKNRVMTLSKTRGEVPPPLVGPTSVFAGGRLFLFGGRLVSARLMTNDLYVLDLGTMVWQKHRTDKDTVEVGEKQERQGGGERRPKPRYFHSANVWGSKMIIFGGMGYSAEAEDGLCVLNDVWVLDTDTMEWSCPSTRASAIRPKARYAHLSAVSGSQLLIFGGQDIANAYIAEVNVLDLRSWTWITNYPFLKHAGAYRSVAMVDDSADVIQGIPTSELLNLSPIKEDFGDKSAPGSATPVADISPTRGRMEVMDIGQNSQRDSASDELRKQVLNATAHNVSLHQSSAGPPVYIYSNHNFANINRELHVVKSIDANNVRMEDRSASMTGHLLPPGLRFPSGAILGHHLLLCGTYLTPQVQTFTLWALNLSNSVWTRVDIGSTFQTGSWNRGVIDMSNARMYVFGHRGRNLLEDYNHRQLNFDHFTIVDLESLGLYRPPRHIAYTPFIDLGLHMLNQGIAADMTVVSGDGQKFRVNSVILRSRWPFVSTLFAKEAAKKSKQAQETTTNYNLAFPESSPIVIAFLQFIYTDSLSTPQQLRANVVGQLLLFAKHYRLPRLWTLCIHTLHQMLNIATAALIYETAALGNHAPLQIRALKAMIAARKIRNFEEYTSPEHPHPPSSPIPSPKPIPPHMAPYKPGSPTIPMRTRTSSLGPTQPAKAAQPTEPHADAYQYAGTRYSKGDATPANPYSATSMNTGPVLATDAEYAQPEAPTFATKARGRPSLSRLGMRIVILILSVGAFGFSVGASPYSGEGFPFSNQGAWILVDIAAWLTIIVSFFHIFIYCSRRFRRGEKMKRWIVMLVDLVLAVLWGAGSLIEIIQFKCTPGTRNGWCNFYNTSIACAFVVFVLQAICFFWDVFGGLRGFRKTPTGAVEFDLHTVEHDDGLKTDDLLRRNKVDTLIVNEHIGRVPLTAVPLYHDAVFQGVPNTNRGAGAAPRTESTVDRGETGGTSTVHSEDVGTRGEDEEKARCGRLVDFTKRMGAKVGCFLWTFASFVGPGYVIAVGYMDPGNWATDLQGGSSYGYALLTVIFLSNVLAVLLQMLAIKLGVVSGLDLAQACRYFCPRWLNIILYLLCEAGIVACDLAEVIGSAIALKLLFNLALPIGVAITALDTLLILFAYKDNGSMKAARLFDALIMCIVGAVGICFIIQLAYSHPDPAQVMNGYLPTAELFTNPGMLYIAIGIIGATVMPHNLYLHSHMVLVRRSISARSLQDIEQDKEELMALSNESSRDETSSVLARLVAGVKQDINRTLRFSTLDSTIALTYALFVNSAILIVSAANFYYQTSDASEIGNGDLITAHDLLKQHLGPVAGLVFAIALLASGQSSTMTATMAGQIIMSGFLGLRIRPWLRRLLTRLVAIVPAMVVVLASREQGLNSLLVASQVALSLQLPFAVIPLVYFTSRKGFMDIVISKTAASENTVDVIASDDWKDKDSKPPSLGSPDPSISQDDSPLPSPMASPVLCTELSEKQTLKHRLGLLSWSAVWNSIQQSDHVTYPSPEANPSSPTNEQAVDKVESAFSTETNPWSVQLSKQRFDEAIRQRVAKNPNNRQLPRTISPPSSDATTHVLHFQNSIALACISWLVALFITGLNAYLLVQTFMSN